MITIKHRGSFRRTDKFFERLLRLDISSILEKYGQLGVEALAAATPIDSGETAASWSYTTEKGINSYRIVWRNSHINDGVPIAIILQYGHGTGTGGYVRGTDYINPALVDIFNNLADEAWKEVIRA